MSQEEIEGAAQVGNTIVVNPAENKEEIQDPPPREDDKELIEAENARK